MTRKEFVRLCVMGMPAAALVGCGRNAYAAASPARSRQPATSIQPAGSLPSAWAIPTDARATDYRQEYPLSCEVACFRMVLFNYNMDASEEQLMAALGENENPDRGFRGDYRSSSTSSDGFANYGAHAPAVKRLVDAFPHPGTFNGIVISELDQARAALARNWLTIVWIPVGLTPSEPTPVTLSDGQAVNIVPGEHTIVLHGYDQAGFDVYDPEPDPHLPDRVTAGALASGMALFDNPGLAIQPLF
jgi:uncharacterized protein YvpB